MKCTGKDCPLEFGKVEKCTVHNCKDRTKPTNFDKITKSVESLAKNLVESIATDWGTTHHKAGNGKLCATWEEAVQLTIEWLRQEAENA